MYLGIDYGKKKIGLAISEGFTASPFGTITNTKSRIAQIQERLKKIRDNITYIIIGLPTSPMAEEIKNFAQELQKTFNCPVNFQDETNTTKQAIKNMIQTNIPQKKRKKEDGYAAAQILQQYLETQAKNKDTIKQHSP